MAAVRSLAASLAFALVLAGPAARAEGPAAKFGDRGTVVFGGDVGIGGQQGLDHGYDTRVSLELDPALDVFVARHLSLGVGSTLAYSFARASPSSSLVSASPRVGYVAPLGPLFVLWPRVSVDLAYAVDAASQAERVLSATLFVPVDALLLPHVTVGVGPALTQQLLRRTDAGAAPLATTAQLLVELAGWL